MISRLLAAIDRLLAPSCKYTAPVLMLDLHDENGVPRCCCRSAARIGTCEPCGAYDHLSCPERAR